ncbi:hypothetical protein AB9K41_26040 [Cribrihabitans sp. XS_ASV171]
MPARPRQPLSANPEASAMNEIIGTKHTPTRQGDDHRSRTPSKPLILIGEMTYLILMAVAAALLTGLLALPFTMPGRVFAEPPAALDAADLGHARASGPPPA